MSPTRRDVFVLQLHKPAAHSARLIRTFLVSFLTWPTVRTHPMSKEPFINRRTPQAKSISVEARVGRGLLQTIPPRDLGLAARGTSRGGLTPLGPARRKSQIPFVRGGRPARVRFGAPGGADVQPEVRPPEPPQHSRGTKGGGAARGAADPEGQRNDLAGHLLGPVQARGSSAGRTTWPRVRRHLRSELRLATRASENQAL